MIGRTLSHFKITAKLGEGGMGEVWRAEDTKLDRDVAIKVLPAAVAEDSERLARFEREAKLLASLNHQNIAGIYEVGEDAADGSTVHFLAMELAEGDDLAERLKRGPLPEEEAVRLARQLAQALEAAHEKGIIHRDLKPQNIKLTPDGSIKVLDFGLAKALEVERAGAPSARQLTHSPTMTLGMTVEGVILGTAAYMSPEQAKGQAADKRADIWAFGVVVWEMLTGQSLFSAETGPETLAKVLTAEPDLDQLPLSTPPALRRLLRRCLERNPQNRLRHIGDARLVLTEIESGVEEEAPTGAQATPAESARGRGRELVAWVVALLALLAAGALYLSRPTSRPTGPRIIRSTLSLPAGVTIELDGTRAGMPALSPDGTRIAFGARRGREPLRIWIHDLATSEVRALAGTEGGYRPFWSPDGSKIGFFTWDQLLTTTTDQGLVTPLARARDARGGTWSRNGAIVFSPYSIGAMRVVPENGGEVALATSEKVGDAGTHRFPWLLPDSQHFLYLDRLSRAGGARGASVRVGRLGTTEPIARLVEEATNAVYSNGYLLFLKGSALVAQPFDPESLTLSGEPSVLVNDVLVNRRFTYGVFSVSENGILAFLTGRQRDLSRLVWRDRSGAELGQLGDPVNLSGYGGLALSPDGIWAAASIVDAGTTSADVWLFDLRRGTRTRIGSAPTDDYEPMFSPDSKSLIYGSYENRISRIIRRDLASGEETLVFSQEASFDVSPMFIPPDGASVIAANRNRATLDSDMVKISLDGGGEPQLLLGGPEDTEMGQLSPDGQWLAWASDESGRHEIYVARYPGGETRLQASRNGGYEPRWSRDGTELLYKAPDNWINALSIEQVSGTLAVGEPERLFQVIEFDGSTYAVSADGERFLTREPLTEQDASSITLLTDWPAALER